MCRRQFTFVFAFLSFCVVFGAVPALSNPAEKPASSCFLCQRFMNQATKVLVQYPSLSQEDVLTSMVKSCNADTNPIARKSCLNFVESYGIISVNYLQSGQTPKSVCSLIGVCQSQTAEQPPQYSLYETLTEGKPLSEERSGFKADARCELCKFFVALIDKTVGDEKNLQTVNATLRALCHSLTDVTLKTLCLTLEPQVVQLVAQGLDPTKSCQAANFCPAESLPDINVSNVPGLTCNGCHVLIEDLAIAANRFIDEEHDNFCTVVQLCGLDGLSPVLPQISAVKDGECDLCKFLVEAVDAYVENNKTEAAINTTLYNLCNSLPLPLKSLCTSVAPAIVNALVNGLDPVTVCTEIKLCSSGLSVPVYDIIKNKVEVKSSVGCDICEFLIDTADQYLQNNKSEAAINATIYKLCNDLPGTLQSFCYSYAPTIVKVLAEGLDPQKVCTEIGLCSGTRKPSVLKPKPKQSNTLECEICEFLVDTADQYLQNNKSEAAINATIYKLCNDLPSTFQPICMAYAPQIVAALAKGLDPQKVCTEVKLCTGNGTRAENVNFIPVKKSNIKNTLECEICEFLIDTADQYLQNNKSEAAINATIYKLCNDLPSALQSFCFSYAPQIVAALSNGLDPQTVCTEIKLCTGINTDTHHSASSLVKPLDIKNTLECEICEFLVDTADQYLQNNKSEAAINATIYKLCNDLPSTFQPICMAYAPQIVAALAKGLDPQKVCTEVKLCTGNGTMTVANKPDLKVKSLECELCEYLLSQLDSFIKNRNFTPAEVNNTLFGLCKKLPISYQPFCDYYGGLIVNLIVHGVDPSKVCSQINLCKEDVIHQEAQRLLKKNHMKQTRDSKLKLKTVECDICEFVVAYADGYIKNANLTPAEINNTIYGLCNDLPASFQSFCYSFAPKIVQVLINGVDPEKACTEIKLCTAQRMAERQKLVTDISKKIPEKQPQLKSLECDICEFIVANADAYIKNKNFTPAELNNTIYGLCNDLPPSFQSFCYSFAPKIVQVLINGVDPEKACTEIKLCTAQRMAVRQKLMTDISKKIPEKQPQLKSLECDICEFIVANADAYIKNKNFTPAELNNTIYGLCNDLPPSFQSFCYSYAPKIVEVLENGVDPEKACVEIKLCTSTALGQQRQVIESVKGPVECALCEALIQEVDSILKSRNKTESDLNGTVYGICDQIPRAYQQYCYSEAPMLVKILAGDVDPKELCAELNICASKELASSNTPKMFKLGGIECDACKVLFATLDDDLYKDEKKVKGLLNEVCHRLPPPTDQKCLGFVTGNFDELWEKFLSKILSPDGVCKLLKLCK